MPRADVSRPSYLNSESLTETVLEGHAWEYFSKKRTRVFSSPIRVGYTTWKSRVGLRTEIELENDERFEFRSIRSTVAWDELRELYHWCDIFLSTPDGTFHMQLSIRIGTHHADSLIGVPPLRAQEDSDSRDQASTAPDAAAR